ncbi:hypothetical protein [Mycobacteroides abscessus]|uniref:hypothetical protein n=1 Tax=Mycobacteroides abscessus TaxID=36809 RepID=UPI000C260ADF|nr:hypothetical protein [Mycobacteroides abscessus]
MNALSTTGGQTATVETLTAEVRTLMVGSRQVTMSVAKQIDVVPLASLTPFGRINIGGNSDSNWVIGAHSETGALCRSHVFARIQKNVWVEIPANATGKPLRCRKHQPLSRNYDADGSYSVYELTFDGWPIRLDEWSMEDRHAGESECQCTDECRYWDPRDHRQLIATEVSAHRAAYEAERQRIADAKALPLIVLAGLR